MATSNISVGAAWTKVAETADTAFLVTCMEAAVHEIATTAADTAPTVQGHPMASIGQVTRASLGPGYVWARRTSVAYITSSLFVVSK